MQDYHYNCYCPKEWHFEECCIENYNNQASYNNFENNYNNVSNIPNCNCELYYKQNICNQPNNCNYQQPKQNRCNCIFCNLFRCFRR